METATVWLITGIIAAGILGPIVRAWSIHLRLLDIQRRLKRLEDNSLSDMNREKAAKRWNQRNWDQEALEVAKKAVPETDLPWWATKTGP